MKEDGLNEGIFKVGDKVKCISANKGSSIKEGSIYTIDKIILVNNFCTLKEIKASHNYAIDRFVLHNEQSSKEDKNDIEENRRQLEELIKILN
jgi:hypothetical protein